MKKFSKALALCLAAVLLAGLFTACGKSYNFTSADAVDSSDSQQRWLKYPESSVVINPAAVSGEDTTDKNKQSLSIGIGDKTVDDVLFTLEDASANGTGGSIEWEADFTAETTKFKNMTSLTNNSKGSALDVVIPDTSADGKELDAYNTYTIRGIQDAYQYDFINNKYYLVIETGECAEMVDINLYTFAPTYDKLLASVGANETKVVCINDLVRSTNEEDLVTDSTRAFFDIHFKKGGAYQFKSFAVKVMPSGVQAATSVALEYAPYALKNTATYPNGTVVETSDFFYDTATVTRKVTLTSNGSFAVGGKIADGAEFTYNDKDGYIEVNGANGINYCIKLAKKDTVKFYATEADMLSDKNALESASGAKFWTTAVTDLTNGESAYFSVAASTSEKADALEKSAKNGASQNKARKRLETLPSEWDEYIKSHGDVENYIKNIPETK